MLVHALRSLNMEDLPIEMQTAILKQVPDTQSLKNLVHASPVLHLVYKVQRASVLQAVLQHEIGLCSPHALAFIEASSIKRDTTAEEYAIFREAFCRRYHDGQQIKTLSLNQTFALLRLH